MFCAFGRVFGGMACVTSVVLQEAWLHTKVRAIRGGRPELSATTSREALSGEAAFGKVFAVLFLGPPAVFGRTNLLRNFAGILDAC